MRRDFYRGDGSLLGYTVPFNERRIDCYDQNGRFVGWVDDTGTYDESGRRVSMDRIPGMLFGIAAGNKENI